MTTIENDELKMPSKTAHLNTKTSKKKSTIINVSTTIHLTPAPRIPHSNVPNNNNLSLNIISTFPSQVSFTTDQLKRAFGFRNIESILPHIKATSHSNFSITSIDKEKKLDLGEIATINKSKRNTNPLPLPLHFGDVVHMDIIYGSVTAIESYRYGLFIVDRATRSRFIYPMKILKTDILPTLQKFCNNIGMRPKRILTDFDHKLMGQKVLEMFTPPDCECIIDTAPPPPIIEAAPPYKQNQNGLAESNWKAILQIARAWLTSNLLPPTFWW